VQRCLGLPSQRERVLGAATLVDPGAAQSGDGDALGSACSLAHGMRLSGRKEPALVGHGTPCVRSGPQGVLSREVN
jgi:hypothetical protein